MLKLTKLFYTHLVSLPFSKYSVKICRTFSHRSRRFEFDFGNFQCKVMDSRISTKPLNILVYTGEDSEKGKCSLYESIANNLRFCLNPECYLIYMLQPYQVFQHPWQENLKLLIICNAVLDGKTAAIFETYANNGGQILLICSKFDAPFLSMSSSNTPNRLINASYKDFKVSLLHGGISYEIPKCQPLVMEESKTKSVLFKCEQENAVIVSEVHIAIDPALLKCKESEFVLLKEANSERLMLLKDLLSNGFSLNCSETNIPNLTPCYLFVNNKLDVDGVISKMSTMTYPALGMQLLPVDNSKNSCLEKSTDKKLVVAFNVDDNIKIPFDKEIYFDALKTDSFGSCLFFVPVIGSTMDIVNVLTNIEGACVVARQQICGRGRGGNKWISPAGSAMFSTHFSISLSSSLGQRLPIVQHFIGLSVILAVRKLPGYENIDIRLKWPNDIYYGQRIKIGGILVTSTIEGSTAHVYTGCGVNVSNSQPTMCINDIIKHHNNATGNNLSPLTVEYLIAASLTEFEKIMMDYELNGFQNFLSHYYRYWLHEKQKVTIAATNEEVIIVGLNDYGFLLVEGKNGEKLALQPDGNSFDMLKNLISVK